MNKIKICWGTRYNPAFIGNAYGYRIHNETLLKYVSQIADISDEAEDVIIICSLEFYNKKIEGKRNWLFTMFEGTTLPDIYVESLRKADFLLTPSTWVKQLFEKYFDSDKISVVPHGVEKDFFYRRRRISSNTPFRFFYEGAANPRKGYEELIYAWKYGGFVDSPRVELYVKTTGIKKSEVEKKGNVILDGRNLDRKELINLYHKAHCFVLPTRGEGFGLCVSPDTWIPTEYSAKRMKDVEIGDSVLSQDSKFHLVQNKVKREANVLEFRIRGVPSIRITNEHPFWAVKRKLKCVINVNNLRPSWIKATNLEKGDMVGYPRPKWEDELPEKIDFVEWFKNDLFFKYDNDFVWMKMGFSSKSNGLSISGISKRYNATKRVVEKSIRALTERKNTRLGSNTDRVSKALKTISYENPKPVKINRYINVNEEFLELVGWYLAEGSGMGGSGIEFSLSKKEIDVAEKLSKIISNLFGSESSVRLCKGKSVCSVDTSSKIISRFFEELCGKGAGGKRMHPILLRSAKYLGPLIRCYFMGDGHRYKKYGGYSVTTVSSNLAWQIRNVLATNGIQAGIRYADKNGGYGCNGIWTLNIGGVAAEILCDWSGLDNRKKCEKKASRHYILTKDYIFTPVLSIKEIRDEQKVMDIQVEDSHSFVGNGVLLHNTLAQAMATGLPCIATDYSGVKDFFDDIVGYPVKYKMGKGEVTFVGDAKQEKHETEIAFPLVEDLIVQMINVVKDYKSALKKGKLASIRMRSFNWNNSAKILVDLVKEKQCRS